MFDGSLYLDLSLAAWATSLEPPRRPPHLVVKEGGG